MDKKAVAGRDTNRLPLHEVVPRSVPFAIGIAPSDICNFKCNYCSQAVGGVRDARILPWDDYCYIIDQIIDLTNGKEEKLKILRYIGNGEPLINKDTPDMVRLAVRHKLADRYEVTTNGSLLTHEMSDRLIEAGLTRLLISVQGISAERYQQICGYRVDFDKFVEQIEYFYNHSRNKCTVFVKTVETVLENKDETNKFYKIFDPIADQVSVENIIASSEGVDFSKILTNDEMNQPRYNTELIKKDVCDTLFMYMNIHSNGDVDPCGCLYPPLFIGNVFKTPLNKIWNGQVHKDIMMKHLCNRRNEIPTCSKCISINLQSGFKEDYLDPYKKEIIERVELL